MQANLNGAPAPRTNNRRLNRLSWELVWERKSNEKYRVYSEHFPFASWLFSIFLSSVYFDIALCIDRLLKCICGNNNDSVVSLFAFTIVFYRSDLTDEKWLCRVVGLWRPAASFSVRSVVENFLWFSHHVKHRDILKFICCCYGQFPNDIGCKGITK